MDPRLREDDVSGECGRVRKVNLFLFPQPNLLAFWDTLQRYMDVEQTLPDLPILEQSRHLDPVTVEHDKAQNRPERRWRDMDVKAWRRKEARALREKLAAYPWQQQPCVLRERIDSGLSIEAYYRRQ